MEIITRDRNQPGVILDIQPLERFTDYTIEPFTGRLVFRRPVPSVDDKLNPVSIRVSYESETGGDSFWVFGADARADATDRVSLGAGFVRDDNPAGRYDLFSANAGLTLGEGTWMNGEFARSDSAGIQKRERPAGRASPRFRAPGLPGLLPQAPTRPSRTPAPGWAWAVPRWG